MVSREHPIKLFQNIGIDQDKEVTRLKSVLDNAPASTGKKHFKNYLNGSILNASQSINAFCCQCMGFYHDGRIDCKCPTCPLYRFMPYGLNRKKYIRPDRKENNGNHEG